MAQEKNPLEPWAKDIDEVLGFWDKRNQLTVVDHPFAVPQLRTTFDRTQGIPTLEERFNEPRVELTHARKREHLMLEVLADEWLRAKQPDHLWWVTPGQMGSKCTINDDGMATLAYTDEKLQVQANVCFWGRSIGQARWRILAQLDKVAAGLADTHTMLKERKKP